MTITGAIVVFAVLWFLVLFMVLPQGVRSQSEAGEVEPGTPGSAPTEAKMRRKLIWTTAITVVLWTIIVTIILSDWVHIQDIDLFGRARPRDDG